jgi:hypothetical protein
MAGCGATVERWRRAPWMKTSPTHPPLSAGTLSRSIPYSLTATGETAG